VYDRFLKGLRRLDVVHAADLSLPTGQWLFDSIRYAAEHDPALLREHVEFTDRSPLHVVIFATG
jgi:hypothetical protein